MSKVRIYELAKELGVENKIVITIAQELGFSGKSSHSSSLDGDEADQIRRAVIRKAIGVAPDTEVVTKRVDRSSGATGTFVERRKGDVIRRRRHDEENSEVVESTSPILAQQESLVEHSDGSLAFKSEPEVVEPVEEIQEEVETPEEIVVEEVEVAQEEAVSAAPQAEPIVEQAPVVAVEVAPTPPPVEAPVAAPAPAAVAAVTEQPVVVRKGPGPKVLGRIELAPRKPVKSVETKKSTPAEGWSGKVVVADEPEEESKDKDKGHKPKDLKKGRGRKKEFTRFDLVDYEGNEVRRGRGSKSGKKDDDRKSQAEAPSMKASKRVVEMMADAITVGELARQMSVKSAQVIAKLIQLGVMATINQAIDKDTTEIVAEEFGFTVASTAFDESEILETKLVDAPETLKQRSPIVTVMGHVDHGKTSLLDAIRKASVVTGEAGGITQHIGAYMVSLDDGKFVTFIDTPGHAAFTSMRARGAQVTDIVILVVAADEGPMPQTIEAYNHAKAAGVNIVVALSKCDKPEANPDRVKQQLAEIGLNPEEWGGDTMYFQVSAAKKQGIKELLEGLLLVAEMKELKANPDRKARGTVIETRQDRGRGIVATVLVQTGTLRVGDIFVTGAEYGRVRSMNDDKGVRLTIAGPSTPVEITGLGDMPSAGDDFFVVDSDAQARDVAGDRKQKIAAKERALASGPISLEEFARRANNVQLAELNVILKGDVHGSIEALKQSIEKMSTLKVKVRVLHGAIGAISESDVALAKASNAIIVGFNVRAEPRAAQDADVAGIELRFYRVIYELLNDVKKAMAGLLDPIKKEKSLGRVEVRNTFTVPKVGTVAGCFVLDGTVKRSAHIRLVRDGRVIHEGKLASLRRFKDDVREVQSGYECGAGIDGYNDIKVGDILEVYEIEEVAASLE